MPVGRRGGAYFVSVFSAQTVSRMRCRTLKRGEKLIDFKQAFSNFSSNLFHLASKNWILQRYMRKCLNLNRIVYNFMVKTALEQILFL